MTHRLGQHLYLNFFVGVGMQEEQELEDEPCAGGGAAEGRNKQKR